MELKYLPRPPPPPRYRNGNDSRQYLLQLVVFAHLRDSRGLLIIYLHRINEVVVFKYIKNIISVALFQYL